MNSTKVVDNVNRVKDKKSKANEYNRKARAKKKAQGLVRLHVSIGKFDVNVINALGQIQGMTASEVVMSLMDRHWNDPSGMFPDEGGCLWESQEGDLDLSLPKDYAARLTQYGTTLTSGEIIEILLGLELYPFWDDEEPRLLGSFPGITNNMLMMTCHESYWRRRNRRFQMAIARGEDPDEVWPDWSAAMERSQDSALREWESGAEFGSRHAVKVAHRSDGQLVYLNWGRGQSANDLMDDVFAKAA